MITIKKTLYMTVPFLTAMTSCVQANDDTSSGTFTIGLGGHYTPRYSGSDKQVWQVVPVLQGRNGVFSIDTQKGVGYDLQNASGWYFEHTLGYDLSRADKNVNQRAGVSNLKGTGDIDASLNTALAVGWQALLWLNVEGKVTLPLTDSQGVSYQTSSTLLPVQTDHDTVTFQTAALFGDSRYLDTWYGADPQQSQRSDYSRYSAPGGFYGIGNSLTWNRQFDAHWGTFLSANYTWLGEHANESPIVLRRNGAALTAAVIWTFQGGENVAYGLSG